MNVHILLKIQRIENDNMNGMMYSQSVGDKMFVVFDSPNSFTNHINLKYQPMYKSWRKFLDYLPLDISEQIIEKLNNDLEEHLDNEYNKYINVEEPHEHYYEYFEEQCWVEEVRDRVCKCKCDSETNEDDFILVSSDEDDSI